jgi:hypothetical protein
MRTSALFLMVCGSLALAACGDDSETSSSSGGGSGGGGTTSGTTSSTSGTPGTTSSSSTSSSSASSTASTSSGEQGGGGSGQGGGTGGDGGSGTGGDGGSGTGGDGGSGTGGDGGSGGGDGGSGGNGTGGTGGGGEVAVCDSVVIDLTSDLECDVDLDSDLQIAATVPCEDPFTEDTWIGRFYALTVAEGDCVYMRADNAGSLLGADVWGAIIDPTGTNLIFDEEVDCTVENPDGYICPEGAITMESAGTAYVMVGAYGGDACPVDDSTPFQLWVSVNGTDIDLDNAAVCEGDLNEII